MEDIIGKIINVESHKCEYIPSSSTSVILNNLKAQALEEMKKKSENDKSQPKEDLQSQPVNDQEMD